MIDLAQYNLVYTRNVDQRKFLVRLITKMNYSAIDTQTGEVLRLTQARLKRDFKPVKELNKINRKKRVYLQFGRRKAS